MVIDEPCSCVCLADSFAIVGTDKFYKINLDHPSLTGILKIMAVILACPPKNKQIRLHDKLNCEVIVDR